MRAGRIDRSHVNNRHHSITADSSSNNRQKRVQEEGNQQACLCAAPTRYERLSREHLPRSQPDPHNKPTTSTGRTRESNRFDVTFSMNRRLDTPDKDKGFSRCSLFPCTQGNTNCCATPKQHGRTVTKPAVAKKKKTIVFPNSSQRETPSECPATTVHLSRLVQTQTSSEVWQWPVRNYVSHWNNTVPMLDRPAPVISPRPFKAPSPPPPPPHPRSSFLDRWCQFTLVMSQLICHHVLQQTCPVCECGVLNASVNSILFNDVSRPLPNPSEIKERGTMWESVRHSTLRGLYNSQVNKKSSGTTTKEPLGAARERWGESRNGSVSL